ncbi:MAG: hypothetical protein ACRCXV_02785, partial [Bacteroidales bacterium]
MNKLTFSILLIGYLFSSCVKPGLNYPYAENNSTVDSIFDLEIKDDYKWLEGNNPDNEKRNQWLA